MIVESHTPPQPHPAAPAEPHALQPRPQPAHAAPVRTGPVHVPVSWYVPCKRLLDVTVAFLLLLVAAPVVAVCAALVRLTSRGPAFYSQVRAGRGGKPFVIWKLRSMYHNCEQFSGVVWAKKGDSRVTPFGAFLRRTHLDELPQLWNVLKGDMSLVGPRPERPEFVPQLEQAVPRYRERMQVLPGVTGLAQIHQGPDTDLASVERKLAFDLHYVKTLSFTNDAKIIFATALHVVRPLAAGKWFFSLTAQSCAEAVGLRLRESSN
jgi:lipopolysaccharide/colanic/teichoic acid biosynthesis glycosyltransferase